MRKNLKKAASLMLASTMALSLAACGGSSSGTSTTAADTTAATTTAEAKTETQSEAESKTDAAAQQTDKEPVTLKMTWWGSQTRHDQTQQVIDLYTELNPHVTFEVMPSGWDGYFDKLSTQTASGSMPDIVQMDYLYITTYAQNNSLADLQPFIDDGTLDVSTVDENLLNTGRINGKLAGMVLSSSLLAVGYNPDVLAEAGVAEPTSDWKWADYVAMNKEVYDKTGKFGSSMDPVLDTNLFNYWVRQHGASLFAEDKKSLGYEDDKIAADFIQMWKDMMDANYVPNPDEFDQISTLGIEAGPVVTGEAAMTFEWNNYASKVSASNDKIKVATPPLSDDSEDKGLWLKPGMFFSVAETSTVKKEAAEFINWFMNSEEANDIMMAERGTPTSSAMREYLVGTGKMAAQQQDMFKYVDDAIALCGETPAPDPVGMSEVNAAFKNAAAKAFYGQISAEEAAAEFRQEANAILARNN